VFLAHSKEDKSLVREIFFLLKLDGFLPWFDEENLIAGQNWKFEIEKAVEASHVVALFISPSGIDRAGYLHKELSLAMDVAERQPECTICLVPILLGGSVHVPRILSHLQWQITCLNGDVGNVVSIYRALQRSLLVKALELGQIKDYELDTMLSYMRKDYDQRVGHLNEGIYLVRGQNPKGSKYYGIAEAKSSHQKLEMTWNIGGHITKCYEKEASVNCDNLCDPDAITLVGDYEVTYEGPSVIGTYSGTWGPGGIEDLIPASPLARGDRLNKVRF
jgi:hypothetical protein